MIPVPGYSVGTPYGRRGPYWSCNEDASGNGVHTGVDYPAPTGARIVAARGGTVNHVNFGSAFGYHQFTINPGDGTRDFYAHTTSRPAHGSHVGAGAAVAKCGAEGNVTGPHLHFERHGVSSGGWSCSIHRDPAPSINYQPSSGSGGSGAGSGGQDDDMPKYAGANLPKAQNLKADTWTPIPWDPGSGDVWDKDDAAGILLSDSRYVATLTARVTDRDEHTVSTRFIEREDGEAVEENPQVTHDRDYMTDTRVGNVGKGRRLRVQVKSHGAPAVLSDAHITVVYW